MQKVHTLIEGLVCQKNRETGIVFIHDDNTEEFIRYGDLIELAKNYLSVLQEAGLKKDDEAILAFHSIKNFVVAYWSCLFGGIIPVPLVLPKNEEEVKKAVNVWKVLMNPWIIVDDETVKDKFEKKLTDGKDTEVIQEILDRMMISTECDKADGGRKVELAQVVGDDIAFIQFSSGSTGNPKGVVLTHKNLLCNIEDFVAASQITLEDTMFSWKPITHDFGMIAFHLLPVVVGITQYRMTTKHFIWNATDWFSFVNRHRITMLGSPNFGIQHFLNRFDIQRARREKWDLSCVRMIYNAAEMIHPELCERFKRVLGEFGIPEKAMKSGYGLAENTLVASGCKVSEYIRSIVVDRDSLGIGDKVIETSRSDRKGIEYVLCGAPCNHSEIRIADAEGNALEEDYVGHIYIKGDCVTSGYYRNEQATREIIKNQCWLDTQDVGFLHDGELVMIGRQKEVIIIGGINYYPRDIEDAILEEIGYNKLNQYIACGIQNKETGTDDLYIFVYYKGTKEQFQGIEKSVTQAVLEKIGLQVRKVVPIRHVYKTTSGKVQRFRIVSEYLESIEEEKVQAEAASVTPSVSFQQKFKEVLNQYIELEEKDYTTSLFELNMASMQIIKLQQHLENAFHVRLESTFIMDHPTVKDLRNEIAIQMVGREKPEEATVQEKENHTGDVAIVGMAFHFPGDIETEEALWNALSEEADVLHEMPKSRWENYSYQEENITTACGGFLSEVDRFDPSFFHITPKEAESLDPQHRMLLELTWKAFENAGINPLSLQGSSETGVYVGISTNDYRQVGRELGHDPESYTYSGNMFNSAAGRIAYTYGFRGPCEAVDTACSSSLYAIHHAVNAITCNQCNIAAVGAVNLILTPEGHISFTKLNALSPSGRCNSFDDSADGYVRSEGGAVLILKELSSAKEDGDPILGVIKSSVGNHNGHSGGLTVPSGTAQKELITKAIERAGFTIDDISYIEAHGTGTKIGDPQELNALSNVFREKKEKLYVGSVKSNFGHMEAAAGMASVCKVLVSMKHKALPATMRFRKGNTLINWNEIPLSVVSHLQPWTTKDGKLRAGISSFGISGSNAHIVIENYQEPEEKEENQNRPETNLLVLSANTKTSLYAYANRIAKWILQHKDKISDICYSLNTRRARLKYGESFLIEKPEDMERKLSYLSAETIGAAKGSEKEPLVFLFTGQGSQYPKMAQELYEYSPVFRDKLNELERLFQQHAGFSITDILFHCDSEDFGRPLYAQAMIFSVELALAFYWKSIGVMPDLVLGHSIGEIVASCFSNVTDLRESVQLVVERARVIEASEKNGYMVTLFCTEEKAEELVKGYGNVSIAAVNAKENITISGETESLDALLQEAGEQNIGAKKLTVSHPFHSVMMEKMAQSFYEKIKAIHFKEPEIPIISAQTGKLLEAGVRINAQYWRDNLVRPVLFQQAIETAVSLGSRCFVEIGSMAVLSSLVLQDYKKSVVVIPSMRKGLSSVRTVQESAGMLWKLGRTLNWHNFYNGTYKFVSNIPNMCFDYKKIWYQDLRKKHDISKECEMLKEMEKKSGQLPYTRESIEYMKLCLSQITGLAIESMADDLPLFSIGMDSLMLVQLGKRIFEKYQVDIPMKVFFNSLHTIEKVCAYICENSPVIEVEQEEAEPEEKEGVQGKGIPDQSEPVLVQQSMVPDSYETVSLEDKEGLEQIINQQLHIMQKQLDLFSGKQYVKKEESYNVPVKAKKQPGMEETKPKAPGKKTGTYSNLIELEEDVLTNEQRKFILDFGKRYVHSTRKSKEYAEKNREILADWIASLNFNPSIKQMVYPIVSARSKGSKFWDIDGNEYIDTAIGYGVGFFGHNRDFINDALKEQIEHGFELGPQNRIVGEVASLIHDIAGVDRVAFCNTGTEAVMVALRLARAVTGRDKIAKFITSFHGSFDGVLAEADGEKSSPMTIGITQKMIDDTSVLPYGSMESIEFIRKHGADMAAVLVEPVQTRNPSLQPRKFLRELRKVCTEMGIALIFDEMVTGFRIRLGGAQEYFGVKADMVLYGKLAAGGMPIGIVAGDSRYLDAVDGGSWSAEDSTKPEVPTTFFAGTFCKHPLTMAVCKAVFTFLKEHGEEEIERVNQLTSEFVEEVNEFFLKEEVPMKVVNCGSLYKYESLVSTDMSMFSLEQNLFFKLMAYEGIYTWEKRTCFFSLAHTQEDKEKIMRAVRNCIRKLRKGGFVFRVVNTLSENQGSKKKIKLSNEEKRIFILSSLKGGNETYQILCRIQLDGTPDLEKVKDGLYAIAKKHEKLRTCYRLEGREIEPVVVDEFQMETYFFDVGDGMDPDELLKLMNKPYDLARAPLWRYAIIPYHDGRCDLVLSFHHIIVDGTSMELITRELSAYLKYEMLPSEQTEPYSMYVELQESAQEKEVFNRQRNWWLKQFKTLPEQLNLETDAERKMVSDFSGKHYQFQIDTSLYQAVRKFIAGIHTTPFVFYLSAFAVLLQKAGGQKDFCIGVPVDQRIKGNFSNTVGMFAQSLPIRMQLGKDQSFSEFLSGVQEQCFDAIENSMYSYDELVQDLNLEKDYSRNALFDVMFTYTNGKNWMHQYGNRNGVIEEIGTNHAAFDLSLELIESDGCLFGDLDYASPLFHADRMEQLMSQFSQLIRNLIQEPDSNLWVNEVKKENRSKLMELGQGQMESNEKNTLQIFHEAFETYEADPAISFGGQEISYGVLRKETEKLAGYLQKKGLVKGDLVGIMLPIQPAYLSLMLAIQKIGCAWMPIDVNYPVDRIQYMIDNSKLKAIVTEKQYAELVKADVHCLLLEEVEDKEYPVLEETVEKDDLCYVIYTSGSSGNPKGVMLSNGALANFLIGMKDALDWKEGKRVACMTTPSFDIFLLETLLTLAHGGCVVLARREETLEPSKIADFIVKNQIDYMQITPTRLRLLMTSPKEAKRVSQALEKIMIGGEPFPQDLLRELQDNKNLQIYNVYGPTETCIWSTVKDLTHSEKVSIGEPIRNTELYILDDRMQLVPEETMGSLWIGGAGVAKGYLHNKELTGKQFAKNPFGEGTIYNTGDQAIWRNQELYCLGRYDNQVKIRGYRIELEEIEQVMEEHGAVISAAVTALDCANKNRIIAGVYQLEKAGSIENRELKLWLSKRLPAYMIPAILKEVEVIPQTQNGKVDRNAVGTLCNVEEENINRVVIKNANELVSIWRKILGNVEIGYEDTFFDLGGNSYSIILLHAELEKTYPNVFEVTDLFANPTISKQLNVLEKHASTQAKKFTLNGGLHVTRDWFLESESEGEAGSMETSIPQNIIPKLMEMKETLSCNIEDLLTAFFTIYLNKALNQQTVNLYVMVKRNQLVPVEIDFHKESYLEHVMESCFEQIKDRSRWMEYSDIEAPVKDKNEIYVLCGKRHFIERIKSAEYFDLIIAFGEMIESVVIEAHYTEKVNREVLKVQLQKYIQLVELILKQL